jgi:phosphoribosylanthranilate isomerase
VTRVKICGITRPEDAELAVERGAWAIGLIFHGPSPRAVDEDVAAAIGAAYHRHAVEVTGVFVNEPLDEIARITDRCGLSILQFHGDEGLQYCREIARRTGSKVMKAVRVKDAADLQKLRSYRVDYHLLDAYDPHLYGGTGQPFDWSLAKGFRGGVPVVLSGGLTPDNVGAAVRAVHPFAVDTASGTEASPGVKDPAKVEAFFRAVEAADVEVPA